MASTPNSRQSRPTSAPSNDTSSSASVTSIHMARSTSCDQAKVSKRKGTRSVSTLTPAQLARKRANDREAQRAIRARTKDHIERLESELEDLKSARGRDQTVQELLRRNKALEDELNRLRENMGISLGSSPYSTPVYDDALSTGSGAIPSPRTSPFPTNDFAASAPLPDYTSGYVPFAPNNCENWAATVSSTTIPSNVSSPSSSAADDYGHGAAYLPTSAPNPMVQSPALSGLRGTDDIKMEYEDGNDHGFPLISRSSSASSHIMAPSMSMPANMGSTFIHHQHQAPWGVYPGTYFGAVQSPVH